MTHEDRDKRIARLKNEIERLESLTPVLEHVQFTNPGNIFMVPGNVEERRRAMVRHLGPDKLSSYYHSATGGLAIEYTYPCGTTCVYFDDDLVKSLKKVSQGKCRVELRQETTTKTVILCDRTPSV